MKVSSQVSDTVIVSMPHGETARALCTAKLLELEYSEVLHEQKGFRKSERLWQTKLEKEFPGWSTVSDNATSIPHVFFIRRSSSFSRSPSLRLKPASSPPELQASTDPKTDSETTLSDTMRVISAADLSVGSLETLLESKSVPMDSVTPTAVCVP